MSERIGVARIGGEYRLMSGVTIKEGEFLFRINGEMKRHPSRYSVQVGHDCHIDLGQGDDLQEILDRYYWRFMNHHCDPNAIVRGQDVYAIRAISAWEQITFNYNTTEYMLAEPFACHCDSRSCSGLIQGFKSLSDTERERMRSWLAPHLLDLLDGRRAPGPDAVVSDVCAAF